MVVMELLVIINVDVMCDEVVKVFYCLYLFFNEDLKNNFVFG